MAIVDSTYLSPPPNIGIGLSADTAMLLLLPPPLLDRGCCCCCEVTSQSPREGPAAARQLVIHMTAFIVPQLVLLLLHLRPPPLPFPQMRRPSLLLFLRRFVPSPSSLHFCTGEQRAKFCCVALQNSVSQQGREKGGGVGGEKGTFFLREVPTSSPAFQVRA